jgi:hypothetical protein
MNPDADPKLEALFAVPTQDMRDDARALAGLLTQLERTDRRRGVILTTAGVLGAGLAATVVSLTGARPASLASLSSIGSRLVQWSSQWSLPSTSLSPEGLAIVIGIVALGAAAALAFRLRGIAT